MEAVGGAIIGALVALWFGVLAWRVDTQGDRLYWRLNERLDEVQSQLRQLSSAISAIQRETAGRKPLPFD